MPLHWLSRQIKTFLFPLPRQIYKVCRNETCSLLRGRNDEGELGSRKIDLEEKRVHAPDPMIQEPFFSLPVATPPMTTMGVNPEPVRQEPTEPVVEHEREVQQQI